MPMRHMKFPPCCAARREYNRIFCFFYCLLDRGHFNPPAAFFGSFLVRTQERNMYSLKRSLIFRNKSFFASPIPFSEFLWYTRSIKVKNPPLEESKMKNTIFKGISQVSVCRASECTLPPPLGEVPQCTHWGGEGKRKPSQSKIKDFCQLSQRESQAAFGGRLPYKLQSVKL